MRYSLLLQQKIERGKKFFKTLTVIQRVLKIRKMRNLTLGGKIVIFKTKVISKIAFQSFITAFPKYVVNELEKIQKVFLWNNSTPKINCETLGNDYIAGGLKNVDIPSKIIALQCSWIRRLYDDSFHEWKLIPQYLTEKSFGTSFKFRSDLLFKVIKPSFSHLSTGKFF